MTGLLKSELKRLLSRRMTWGVPAVFAGLMLLAAVLILIFAPDGEGPSLAEMVGDASLGEESMLAFVGGFLVLGTFVLGASLIGADLKSGVLELLLTWEPRRMRLMGSRVITGFIVAFVTGIVLTAFFLGLFWILIIIDGGDTSIADGWWGTVFGILLRTGVTTGLFFVLGMGMALLLRSTVGAIVAFFVYVFIIDSIVGNVWQTVNPYMLFPNRSGFISGGGVVDRSGGFEQLIGPLEFHHGWAQSGLIMALYIGLIAMAGIAWFVRSDVD